MTIQSEHFKKYELKCRCGCGLYIITHEFLEMLEGFRARLNERFGKTHEMPMSTHSCIRCQQHNINEGGTDRIDNGLHRVSLHVPKYYDKIRNTTITREVNAWDGHCKRISMQDLHLLALDEHKTSKTLYGGLGLYDWGIHIDNGSYRLWDRREKAIMK